MGTIFGIGPLEVLVIGILILLVFGPERLPEFTRSLGNGLRRLRETYVAFTQEFKGELEPIAQDIDAVTREIRQEVQAIREAADIRAILQPYTDDINNSMKLETTAVNKALNGHSATPAAPTLPALPTATPPDNTIASPSKPATNGNKPASPRYAQKSSLRPTIFSPIELPDDNPWASIGALIRSDKLDDDNPWRG